MLVIFLLLAQAGAVFATDGTQASPYEKPAWGRYTLKDGTLYAHVFEWPEDGQLAIHQDAKVQKASLLASGQALTIKESETGAVIAIPKDAPCAIATVIKLEVVPAK